MTARRVEDMRETGEDTAGDYAFTVSTAASEHFQLEIGGIPAKVIVDSGASCNVMGRDRFETLQKQGLRAVLGESNRTLYAYGRTRLDVLGSFCANVSGRGSSFQCEFVVVRQNGDILLGRSSAVECGVLNLSDDSANIVHSSAPSVFRAQLEQEFPEVFTGIGLLKDFQATVHVDPTVPPVAQKARPVPFALQQKVSAKLQELLDDDIIEPVQGPTPWVSPIVVAPKPNGDIRLCIDVRRVSEAVAREHYPFPTVEETLHRLNGSTVFTKLDLKASFHQIELDEASRQYTVFATADGLFRYKRLMFGLSSAPELYQQIIQQVLSDCKGCGNIAHDLVVHGTEKEHDGNVRNVLQRSVGARPNGQRRQVCLSPTRDHFLRITAHQRWCLANAREGQRTSRGLRTNKCL